MTVGELARYFNRARLVKKAKLLVVPMSGYERTTVYDPQRLSPNITTQQSCYGYSFLGLLGEVRPFNVAVGTPQAFQCILLPADVKLPADSWPRLQQLLAALGIPTVPYSYVRSNKKEYRGLRIMITDINHVSAFKALLTILTFFKKLGVHYSFAPAFDRAVGTQLVRECVEGKVSEAALNDRIRKELESFLESVKEDLLYTPLPCIR
jgi:uncharacterized protein YbbC (DUF1343 family)